MNRSNWVLMGTIAAVTALETAKDRNNCTIKGRVMPAVAVRNIWLIQDRDTIVSTCNESRFRLAVKPGRYSVLIDAVAPYRDQRWSDLDLSENNTVELGNIELVQ
ncbi:hypothetical protein ACFSQD_04140 [Flavihumibacter stibioxidans]|uniref:Carboxypeptidase regulatory-like domain-containing protein n=1 Tax=Flavihumibacter stibioxidans TaxID=1834163 RepID=A0ABR7M3E2_9BACT|nr:hypothetical protein [Flavihumibacter stibioxidans]MBC6489497.1 hypothetical protein [Flavihumibacter stibioxidans]